MLRAFSSVCLWSILALVVVTCGSDGSRCRHDGDCDRDSFCYQNECVSDEQPESGGNESSEPPSTRPAQTTPTSCVLLSCSGFSIDAGSPSGRDAGTTTGPTRGRLLNLDL